MSFLKTPASRPVLGEADGFDDERGAPRAVGLGSALFEACAGRKGSRLRLRRRREYRTLLKKCPKGIVKGIDYSAVSAEQARKRNADAIQAGRCAVWQGSVEQIIFASGWFDAVTAFETVYFWPGLVPCFREVYRVLKPDGTFLICNECGGDIPGDEKWTQRISGMRIYKDTQLKAALEEAGFRGVQIYKHKRDWLCVLARK